MIPLIAAAARVGGSLLGRAGASTAASTAAGTAASTAGKTGVQKFGESALRYTAVHSVMGRGQQPQPQPQAGAPTGQMMNDFSTVMQPGQFGSSI